MNLPRRPAGPSLPRALRRSPAFALLVGPHALVVLLVAAALFTLSRSPLVEDEAGPNTAECVVLDAFFGNPAYLAEFDGTAAELQRWADAYDDRCK